MSDTITIHKGYPDGTLKLSDKGFSTVAQFSRITWRFDDTSNITSIDKIYKKKNSPNLFIGGPSRKGKDWTGKVMFAPNDVYEYNIKWTEKDTGSTHIYDPKIAVNPEFLPLSFTGFIILVTLVVISIPAVRFLRAKRNRP